MLFGSAWTKCPSTTPIVDSAAGKPVASLSKSRGSKDDEWFVLKNDENVSEVAILSQPSVTDPSFEVIGGEEEEEGTKEVMKAEEPFEEIRLLPCRPDQIFQTVEQLWAKNKSCLTNEKWRAIVILLLCTVVAKLNLFCAVKQEEEDLHIPVPSVLVDEKPSPVYEAYMMLPPQQQQHQQGVTKPSVKPNVVIQSINHPYRPTQWDYETFVAENGSSDWYASKVVQPPREKPPTMIVSGTTTTTTTTTTTMYPSPSRRPAKPMAMPIHDFGGMKDDESVNQTESTSSTFIDPRPQPSPVHAEQQYQSPNEDIIRSLNKQIAELQAMNEEYMDRLTRMATETNSWRSRAVSCDQEMTIIKKKNEELLAKTHRPTKAGGSVIPIPTVLKNEGWTNHHHRKNKQPMASNTIPDNEMLNVSIPYVGDVMTLEERSIRPMGSSALIPSPA